MQEIKKRYIWDRGVLYSAWMCPRCINGTMLIEQEKPELPPFYHCINCGHTVEIKPERKILGNSERKLQENSTKLRSNRKSDQKNGKIKREKTHKKDYKWHFSHAQK